MRTHQTLKKTKTTYPHLNPQKMSHHPATTLSILSITGGVIGYATKRSKPSLIAGLVLGSLFAFSSHLIQNPSSAASEYLGGNVGGYEVALGTSLVLSTAMAKRALKQRSLVPLTMFTGGLLGAGYYAYQIYQYSQ